MSLNQPKLIPTNIMETTEKIVIYLKILCQYCVSLLKFESLLITYFEKKINSKKTPQKSNPPKTIPTQFFQIRYSKKTIITINNDIIIIDVFLISSCRPC